MIDTIDKIIQSYFASVTSVPFTYKGKVYQPKTLRVSPGIFRGTTCPSGCGGCCFKFSLDYLPTESHPEGCNERVIDFDGREIKIYSDLQQNNDGYKCRHLNWDDGRCGIYLNRPFSCDFELIRFITFEDPKRPTQLNQRLFGRGWAMRRIDGERGSKCEMTSRNEKERQEVVRKLKRLKDWTEYFGLQTRIDEIILWASTVDIYNEHPLILYVDETVKQGIGK